MELEQLKQALQGSDLYTYLGKIDKIVGTTVEAMGPSCRIGDVCMIDVPGGGPPVCAEVVGFRENRVLLMPYEEIEGIGYGSAVRNTGERLMIPVSEQLIGRTVDALGIPMDGKGELTGTTYYPITGGRSNPMDRPRIDTPIQMGVKAIDGLLTIGKGQRIGIFAGSGVGKSTLMGMIAKNVKADINVIALVGERGREVLEFVQKDLGEEGMNRSVLVVATSDQPAMLRMKCPLVATTIAEYFRDRGNDVLLMMDSLTRYAMAQREVGLAIGEPPIARGYTPSIYAELPKLLERSGNFNQGSITGVYTVLVEGDDTNEPISDTVRGILDGHIVLSRQLASENHFPAIDIGGSISRLMVEVVSKEHRILASRFRNMMGLYQKNADLISIGAYKKGSNGALDEAVSKIDRMNQFLEQDIDESFEYHEVLALLKEITG